jgi:catechol 2,3-dioxygenase-like lactoylglutathione lyase family enzyme
MVTKIDHVGIAVPDLDSAISFYAANFGMHVVHEETNVEQGIREAMVAAGDDRLQNEGRSYIDAAGTDLSFGVGALWEAIEDRLWVGVSYQSRPNLDGRQALEGTLRNYFTPNDSSESIVFTQQLPDIYRLGFRYRIDPQWEVRLFGDYSRWSAMRDRTCPLPSPSLSPSPLPLPPCPNTLPKVYFGSCVVVLLSSVVVVFAVVLVVVVLPLVTVTGDSSSCVATSSAVEAVCCVF